MTLTRSPMLASFFSSWAFSLYVLLRNFLYSGCCTLSSIATTMVLSILSRNDLAHHRLAESSFAHLRNLLYRLGPGRKLALTDDGLDSRDISLDFDDLVGVIQLVDSVLEV